MLDLIQISLCIGTTIGEVKLLSTSTRTHFCTAVPPGEVLTCTSISLHPYARLPPVIHIHRHLARLRLDYDYDTLLRELLAI